MYLGPGRRATSRHPGIPATHIYRFVREVLLAQNYILTAVTFGSSGDGVIHARTPQCAKKAVMQPPKFSIIIPARNEERVLGLCREPIRVAGKHYPDQWE